jgi:hypothetical protein
VRSLSHEPDIAEHQGPEVDDRKPVGIDGPVGLFGHEVIHDAQEAGGQVKPHGVVAPPPLNHGVLHARKDGVGREPSDRNGQAVDHVQVDDHYHHAEEEPVRHIDVRGLASGNGHDEIEGECKPDDGDGQVDGPLELCVLLALGQSEGQGDDGRDDDGVPTPKHEPSHLVAPQPYTAGTLHRVEGTGHERTAAEGKDDRVGMERAKAPEG